MVTRTFLDKCTTIIQGSKDNFGLNPIGMLSYGAMVSRCLVHFDMDNIENACKNGDKTNIKHTLKLTNCGAIDKDSLNANPAPYHGFFDRERATSFDVIAFRIPEFWDGGRGFDNSDDFWLVGKKVVSQHGANWYYAYDGKEWGTEIDEQGHIVPIEGILSEETLEKEYEKYSKGEESLVIARQHFDVGNENFSFDITDYVNGVIEGKYQNYGIGIAFSPATESISIGNVQYVGFFTNHTNTFFTPVVESRDNSVISDDRYMFFAGKTNKIYFYSILGGIPTDLEELPVCTINGQEYPVKRQNTGIYYATVKIDRGSVSDRTILYDVWSNLKYDGEEFEEVEMEFVVYPRSEFASIGNYSKVDFNLEPSISGINDNEKIYQGDERTLNVIFKVKYSSDYELLKDCQYRLYVKDGKREHDVINWDSIDTCGKNNSFKIKSAELMPGQYHVDIRAKVGTDLRVFKDKLKFTIVDNITNIIH